MRLSKTLGQLFLFCVFALFSGGSVGLADEITETTLNGDWRVEKSPAKGEDMLLTFKMNPAEKTCDLIVRDRETGETIKTSSGSYAFTGRTVLLTKSQGSGAEVTFTDKDKITFTERKYKQNFVRVKE